MLSCLKNLKLLLTTKQKAKIRNTLVNIKSTDIKINKAQLSKIIQSGGFLGNMIAKLGKEALMKSAVPLAKYILPQIATRATSSVIDDFERKMLGSRFEARAVRAGKGFTLFISNDDMDNIIRIIKSLENSSLLIDGFNETMKHKIKKREGGFICALLALMVALSITSVASYLTGNVLGKGVCKTKKQNKVEFFNSYCLYYFHWQWEKES